MNSAILDMRNAVNASMMRPVYLHGALGRKYGKVFHFDVKCASEAIRALCVQLKGFRNDFSKGFYHVVWKANRKIHLSLDGTTMILIGGAIHIIPVLAGASNKTTGLFIMLAGAALLATAFILAPEIGLSIGGAALTTTSSSLAATAISLGSLGSITYGNIAMMGFGLLLLGAGAALAPQISDPIASTGRGLFSAPENVSAQGLAVPLVYGRFLVGSIVISAGLSNVSVPPGSV